MRQRRAPERQDTINEPLLASSDHDDDGAPPTSPRWGIRTLPETVIDLLLRVIKSALSICAGSSKASSAGPPNLTPAARERLSRLQQRVQVAFDEKSRIHRRALGMLWELSFKEDTNKEVSGFCLCVCVCVCVYVCVDVPLLLAHAVDACDIDYMCVCVQGEACEKWKDMGWQGKDPATDFRGSGFLALENLIWFARAHPTTYDQLLNKTEGRRADWEYPFAAAGCNITFMILVRPLFVFFFFPPPLS